MSTGPQNNVYLVRHGETAWSITGQHTGLTDLPLTEAGRDQARAVGPKLKGLSFDHVLTSPLQRARTTCELAGFGGHAVVDQGLVEWDYGQYEGHTLAQVHQQRPDWELFRDGSPGGESVAQVTERADQMVARLRALTGTTLVFSSGHILRVLASRWIDSPAALGRHLILDPACLCVLGYDHGGADHVIRSWNLR